MTERRGRRCKQLLYDLKERTGYCKLKEEALYRTVRRSRCAHLSCHLGFVHTQDCVLGVCDVFDSRLNMGDASAVKSRC